MPVEMRAYVAARAAAHMIIDGRGQLDPSISKAVAARAIVRSSKTAPPRPSADDWINHEGWGEFR